MSKWMYPVVMAHHVRRETNASWLLSSRQQINAKLKHFQSINKILISAALT